MDGFGLFSQNYNSVQLLMTEMYAFLNFFHLRAPSSPPPQKKTAIGAGKMVLFGHLLMIALKGCLSWENQSLGI